MINFWGLYICLQMNNLRIKGFKMHHQALSSLIPLLFPVLFIFVSCICICFFFLSFPFPSHTLSFVCLWLDTAKISVQISVHTQRALSQPIGPPWIIQSISLSRISHPFSLDSMNWDGAFGDGIPSLDHSGRKEGKASTEQTFFWVRRQ